MATALELESVGELIAAESAENAALRDRLETEKRTTALLTELNATRAAEAEALRAALAAKNETITAKDTVIAAQDKLIAGLKAKKPSLLRRLGDIMLGAAVVAVLK